MKDSKFYKAIVKASFKTDELDPSLAKKIKELEKLEQDSYRSRLKLSKEIDLMIYKLETDKSE